MSNISPSGNKHGEKSPFFHKDVPIIPTCFPNKSSPVPLIFDNYRGCIFSHQFPIISPFQPLFSSIYCFFWILPWFHPSFSHSKTSIYRTSSHHFPSNYSVIPIPIHPLPVNWQFATEYYHWVRWFTGFFPTGDLIYNSWFKYGDLNMVIKYTGKSPFIILPFIYIYNWKWWFSSAQTVYQRLTSPCWSWAAVAPPPRTSAPSKARPVWRPSRPWRGARPSAPGHVPGAGTPPMRGGFGKIIQKLGDAGMLHYHVWWPEGVWWGNKGVLKQGIPKIQSFHRQKPWLDDKNPTIFRYTQVSFFFRKIMFYQPILFKDVFRHIFPFESSHG